jgi:hypothetical protein
MRSLNKMRYQNKLQSILTSLTNYPVAVIIKQENLLMLSSTIIKYIKHYQNHYIYENLICNNN